MFNLIINAMTVQHAQIPKILTAKKLPKRKNTDPEPILEPGDKVIYAVIRMHMGEDRTCYPSIATIKKDAHCSQDRVQKAITRFTKYKFIETSRIKLSNGKGGTLYKFPKSEFDSSFDMFTIDFLKMELPILLKEYVMDMQTSMGAKDTGYGKVSHANLTIQNKTGGTQKEIKKFDDKLIDMKILTKLPSGKVDQAGFPIMIREFDLSAINQAKLGIKAVNEQLIATQNHVEEVDNRIDNLSNITAAQYKEMQKELTRLSNRMEKYEAALISRGIDPETVQKEFEM